MKTWQGRFEHGADPLFETFTSSIVQDQRLARYDIQASMSHVHALVHAGLVTSEGGKTLLQALQEIAEEISAHQFVWRDDLEDVHTHVEARLREKIGSVADSLHAGRSRNDQVAADLRLFVKEQTSLILTALLDLQEALVELAERYSSHVMPGFTHLQQAQPVLIAHPLLAYATMLGRDWERFRQSLTRTDVSPLGSGALAGSTFALDRELLARECGFSSVTVNSLDAVSDRDFLVEFVSAAALCMTHLSRISEDIIIWSSVEFGYIRLPDRFSSGSSMMPQKKNPDVAELVRGKTALVIGDAVAALSLVKGLPLGYNRDLQEDKTPLFHAADSLLSSLHILAAMVPELIFDTERAEASLSSFSLATDLADHLVKQGIPFREAHAVIGKLVRDCLDREIQLSGLTSQELAEASTHFGDPPELSFSASTRRKQTSGSTHPDEVSAQIQALRHEIPHRRAIGLPS